MVRQTQRLSMKDERVHGMESGRVDGWMEMGVT